MRLAKPIKHSLSADHPWRHLVVSFARRSEASIGNSNLLIAQPQDSGYVGSEACKDCHEDQFKAFSHTTHSRLSASSSWKGKVTGCESCHGPGKAHLEEGDPKKIISFKTKSSKETSETCLGCHAGKEEHNNFRRGEHWRNDVGCTDCHTSHSATRRAEVIPGQTHFYPKQQDEIAICWPRTCCAEVSRNSASVVTARQRPSLAGRFITRCWKDRSNAVIVTIHTAALNSSRRAFRQARMPGCLKCHADKQGPFVFEHAPLKIEGCSSCHTPHGSANAKLLTRVARPATLSRVSQQRA